ncbi:MAG TPA: bifunctional demethylmenaquinone methyltransferase/2-methoxy-6-polyprenyl-1,4-benzoquinol methylase UbiE [Gammaproteobacteria bacterium]|jgi:demethylmenaquinone methyltransferase/2-methoxy-6-polyprenyl-1,4-benzoquinol methylase|nr:bifunctional demethylmenaquinone methyltransferase/2-methoxy-6-polyprenyl-1,4-benzoquinol methylase UbiE [Gammaproteobacteria bacterium]
MNQPTEPNHTHFGFRDVPENQKATLVADVFHSVASHYDVMNDLMSLGMHRRWKRFTIQQAAVRPGQHVLDVAAGSGDLAKSFVPLVGKTGSVTMTDINESMLAVGRNKLIDAGILHNVHYVQADAEKLPFENNYFDCITIAFGLRNVTHKEAALASFYRVLKPGGKLLILEFSHPTTRILKKLYDLYSFHAIPKMGKFIAKDEASYQYLVESIRKHPTQEVLQQMMLSVGFEDVDYYNLHGGIVALHKGFKY